MRRMAFAMCALVTNGGIPGVRAKLAVGLLVLTGHDEECDGRRVQHLRQTRDVGDASHGHSVKFIDGKMQPILDEVLQLTPIR